jgi:hypothetical protein
MFHMEAMPFRDMLELRSAKKLLGELPGFAHEVRIAGKHAVHHAYIFEEKYSAHKLQEIVGKTRRLVEHLYALSEHT